MPTELQPSEDASTDPMNRYNMLVLTLSHQAAQLQTVVASFPDGVMIVDHLGSILHMNAAGQELLGDAPSTHIQEHVWRYHPHTLAGDPIPAEEIPLARALRGERVVDHEYLLQRSDGTTIRVNVSANPVYDQEGVLIGAVSIFRDVTERRQQEAERVQRLRELEGLREIAQATALARKEPAIYGVLVVRLARLLQTDLCVLLMRDDQDDMFKACVPAYGIDDTAITHYTLAFEVVSQIPSLVETDRPLVLDVRDSEISEVHGHILRSFGVQNAILVRLETRGRIIGLIVAGNKSAHQRFTESDVRLLQTVAPQAALAIENSRLYTQARHISVEAQVQARHLARINDELDAFTYSVSHDLRAPLRAINGFTQLLERSLPDIPERARHQLTRIRVNVEKMSNLIDALLTFSRAGRQVPEKASIDTTAMMRDALQLYAQDLLTCQAQVVLNDLPPVLGDARLLEQVFANLISNAIRYRRMEEPLSITISGTQTGGMVLLVIRDNGSGFDMRYHDKIFQVFQRLHTAESVQGTGIGLALVRKIVERHGGRIWAEATPGKGAAFFVELPAPGQSQENQDEG